MEIDCKKILSRHGGLLVSVFIGLSYAVSFAYERSYAGYFGIDLVDFLSTDMIKFAIRTFLLLCMLFSAIFGAWLIILSEKTSQWREFVFELLMFVSVLLLPIYGFQIDIFGRSDDSFRLLAVVYASWIFARRAGESPFAKNARILSGAMLVLVFLFYIFSLCQMLGEQEAATGIKYFLASESRADKYLLVSEYKDGFIVLPFVDVDKNVLSRKFKIMPLSGIGDYCFEKTPENYSFTLQ